MRNLQKTLILLLVFTLALPALAQEETKEEKELKIFLRQELKQNNEAEAQNLMLQVRNRIKLGEEVHMGLMKRSIALSYNRGKSMGDATAVALEAHNQYQKMRKYGFSKQESQKECLAGLNEGLKRHRLQKGKQMKEQVKEALEEKVQQRLRTRTRLQKGENNASEDSKQLRQRKRLRKGRS